MLIRHSMFYMTARLIPGAMGMATTALLTRVLDPGSYGLYGLALVVMAFGSQAVFDWLGVSFLRFNERRRGDPLVINTVVQMYLLIVLATALVAVAVWVTGLVGGQDATVLASGMLMMWAFSWFELSGRFEIAEYRPERFLTMNVGRGVLVIIGACGAAWLTRNPVWTSVGTAVGTTVAAVVFRSPVRVSLGRAHFDVKLAREFLAFGIPMAVAMGLASAINSGSRALVQVLDSAEALGIYTACFMIVQNMLSISAGGIASAAYQLAVRAVETGDVMIARRQLLENGTLLIAVMAPIAVGLSLTAHGVATTMVGTKFVDGFVELTPWMTASGFFYTLRAHHFDHAFHLGKRPSLQVTVAAVSVVVAIALCFLLIPRYGPVGAAIATTVAMATGCVHSYLAGLSAFPVPIPVLGTAKVALACALMTGFVLMIPDDGLVGLIARVTAGVAAYAAAGLALNVADTRSLLLRRLHRFSSEWRPRPSRQGG